MSSSPTLYHFTCDHSAPFVQAHGLIRPHLPIGPSSLVWMTDLPHPGREAIGLTSHLLDCDRMAWRFTVAPDQEVEPWTKWRREMRPGWAEELERAYAARPSHWWVAAVDVLVELPGAHRHG